MIPVGRQFNNEFGDVISEGVIVGTGEAGVDAVSSETVWIQNVLDALSEEVPVISFSQIQRSAVWFVNESQTSLVDANSIGVWILFHT